MPSNLRKKYESTRSDWKSRESFPRVLIIWPLSRENAIEVHICGRWKGKPALAAALFSPSVLVLLHVLDFTKHWFIFMKSTLGSFFLWWFTWQLHFCCLDFPDHVEDCLVFLLRLLIGNNNVETAIIWLESIQHSRYHFCLL
jgi:hypothetical protein